MTAPRDRDARIATLDALRGLIVVLMALDHTRIFFANAPFDPLDVSHTTAGYFLTRWITHLCAPGFFLLAGLSVWLQEQRGVAGVSAWLAIRGFWLILLEVTVFSLAWSFTLEWRFLGVMWGLGISMVLLSLQRKLPRSGSLAMVAAFLLLHDAYVLRLFDALGLSPVLIYSAGIVEAPLQGSMLVIYPVLPWYAFMLLGYTTAHGVVAWVQRASPRLLAAGLIAIGAFMLLRHVGWGGEPVATEHVPAGMQAFAFMNVEKYPPSLQYALVTLGMLGVIAWNVARRLQQRTSSVWSPLIAFGQEPFFFYAIHLFLIHGAAWAFARTSGWPMEFVFWTGIAPNTEPPAGYGIGLPGVYLVWLAVLAVAWGACVGFHRIRLRRAGWVWRLV